MKHCANLLVDLAVLFGFYQIEARALFWFLFIIVLYDSGCAAHNFHCHAIRIAQVRSFVYFILFIFILPLKKSIIKNS